MLDQISVKTRLYILVILLSSVMVFIGFSGLQSTEKMSDRLRAVYEGNTTALVQLSKVEDNLHRSRGRIWAAMITPNKEAAEKEISGIPGFIKQADEQWAAYLKLESTPEEKQLAADFEKTYKEYRSTLDILGPIAANLDIPKTVEEMKNTRFRENFTASRDKLNKIIEYQVVAAKAAYEKGVADYQYARNLALLLIAGGVILGFVVGSAIVRSIMNPLNEALVTVDTIASGDLTRTVQIGTKAEFGRLLNAMSQMQHSLKNIVSSIKKDAEHVAASAEELAVSSEQVAKSSELQSEASQSIAASIEEMTVSINHISSRTQETSELTNEVGTLSEVGAKVITTTTHSVRNISTSVDDASAQIDALSQKIDQVAGIVSVIKDIADQTNLLALNAAIEAARAGEQGRGFAVVADEVRKLAERTTHSTQEIGKVIDEILAAANVSVSIMRKSVDQVSTGVKMSEQAGQSMQEIQDKEKAVISAVTEIAVALEEQSQASTDIAKQIEHIAQATEENSHAISGTAEASKRLNALGQSLHETVSQFKT